MYECDCVCWQGGCSLPAECINIGIIGVKNNRKKKKQQPRRERYNNRCTQGTASRLISSSRILVDFYSSALLLRTTMTGSVFIIVCVCASIEGVSLNWVLMRSLASNDCCHCFIHSINSTTTQTHNQSAKRTSHIKML